MFTAQFNAKASKHHLFITKQGVIHNGTKLLRTCCGKCHKWWNYISNHKSNGRFAIRNSNFLLCLTVNIVLTLFWNHCHATHREMENMHVFNNTSLARQSTLAVKCPFALCHTAACAYSMVACSSQTYNQDKNSGRTDRKCYKKY